mgnify:CR=1 FL=1
MKITVLNTGGTFNKRYNPLTGELEVTKDSLSLDKIIKNCHNIRFDIKNIISKDSLEFTLEDRELILKEIKNTRDDKIIIIHGTDTIDLSAKFLDGKVEDKKVVFTGAMVPMSIDEVEATMNFAQALGFLNANIENGIYISMHGVVSLYSNLIKNRKLGQFLLND